MRNRGVTRQDAEPGLLVTVITVAAADQPDLLRRTMESVRSQSWGGWEHIVMVRGPGSPAVEGLLNSASRDPRVTAIRQHTRLGRAEATDDALTYVTGRWVAFLAEGDTLVPGALERVAAEIRADPAAVLIYSDWCRIGPLGDVTEVFNKPDWSPERLRGQEYVADLTVMAASRVQAVGGFDSARDAAPDYDLILRVTEQGGSVRHIPEVLYERRTDHPPPAAAWEAGVAAVQRHCDRVGQSAIVSKGRLPGLQHLERTPRSDHVVSIVIPTRGTRGTVRGAERTMVVEAVRSMLGKTAIPFEVVLVADQPVNAPYVDQLRRMLGPRLILVPYDQPFNFSDKVNVGAIWATGDIIVFANDDIEIITDRWLEQLIALAEQADVGLVGALLRFEDDAVQHGGHIYARGAPVHAYFKETEDTGYFGDLLVDHEASGVTAALMACRRAVWSQVGGFSTLLPGSFNDVDFCLKVRAEGLRIVQANCVEAWHYESATRNPTVHQWELDLLHRRWLPQLLHERYTGGPA